MKITIYLCLFVLIAAGAGYTFLLPKYFHAQIHTGLVPMIAGTDKVTYTEDQNQSVLQGANRSITITSYSDLNPLEYHLEVQFKRNNSNAVHTSRIYPAISAKEFGFKVAFENYLDADQKGKIATKDVALTFSTPLSMAVLTHWKEPKYFVTNSKAMFSMGELAISNKVKNDSLVLKDLTCAVDFTSGMTSNLVITNDIKFNEMNVVLDGKNTVTKDFTTQIVIDSINKDGVATGFQQITKKNGPMDLMAAVGHMKHFVNYPFNVKMNGKSSSTEGDFVLDSTIVMNEFNMAKMQDFLKAEINGTFPKKFLEDAILDRVVSMTVNQVGKMFFSPDIALPSSTQDQMEKAKLAKQHESKLSEAVKAILTDTTTGESKLQSLMRDLVSNKLIEQNGNAYTVKATVAKMAIQLNGQDAMSTALPLLMKLDVTTELMAKGFVVSNPMPMSDGRMPASVQEISPNDTRSQYK